MGFFDRFKIKKAEGKRRQAEGDLEGKEKAKEGNLEGKRGQFRRQKKAIEGGGQEEEKKEIKEVRKGAVRAEDKAKEIRGKSQIAFRVLLKPLITEKGTNLAAQNKYIFSITPQMNKIEVKKAIRAIYRVDPIKVNICNFSGKNVRYGRVSGKTKDWKKAIITLKAGDKIEVYEGV